MKNVSYIIENLAKMEAGLYRKPAKKYKGIIYKTSIANNLHNAFYSQDIFKCYQQAVEFIESKDLDAAETILLNILKKHDDDTDVYNLIGNIYFDRGKYKSAIIYYTSAIFLSSNYHPFFHYAGSFVKDISGRIYLHRQEYDKAITNFDKAIFLDHNNGSAFFNRGYCYFKKNDCDKANVDRKRATQCEAVYKSADDYKNYNSKNVAFYNNNIEFAFEFFFWLSLSSQVQKESNIKSLARFLYNSKKYKEIISSFGRFHDLDTEDIVFHQCLIACCHARLTQYNKAISQLKKAIKLKPKTAFLYYDLAALYIKNNNYAAALKNLQQAIKIDESYYLAWSLQGFIHYQNQSYEEALQALNKADKLLEKEHELYHQYSSYQFLNRAFAFYNAGQHDLAIGDFNKALDFDRNNGEIFYNRALAYIAKKNYRAAKDDLKKAQNLGVNNAI